MKGNQVMGGVARKRSKTGAIPAATAALSEVIYVGRASFRVALEIEAPAATAGTAAWFDSVKGEEHRPVILSSGPQGLTAPPGPSEPSDRDAVPILYDSTVVKAVPRRPRASRWTIGLPLMFGGFFCGLLMSPLASHPRPVRERAFVTRPAAPSRAVVAPIAPAVAPIVAPTLPLEPAAAPPVTVLTESFPNRLTPSDTKPGMPVQGRASASQKNNLHKIVPRRPARIASSSSAPTPTTSTWVDPWADN